MFHWSFSWEIRRCILFDRNNDDERLVRREIRKSATPWFLFSFSKTKMIEFEQNKIVRHSLVQLTSKEWRALELMTIKLKFDRAISSKSFDVNVDLCSIWSMTSLRFWYITILSVQLESTKVSSRRDQCYVCLLSNALTCFPKGKESVHVL